VAFTWDAELGRYRTADGRLVRDTAIRSALDLVIAAQAASMRDTTQSLLDGAITLAVWQWQMMQAVKAIHLVGTATAVGGWQQMDHSWNGWTGQRIRTQYNWLVRFSVELSSGKQKLDGTAVARSALYAQAARETHREAQRRLARQRMMGEERRVLGRADHCKTCLQQAKLGWQSFGVLKRLGDSECRSNCRCHYEFRAAA
jgi:hypothetical protein